MSDTNKEPIEIKDQEGKIIAWIDFDEYNIQKAYIQHQQEVWLRMLTEGIPITAEDKYMQHITGVITKERGLVFWHDDGKFYEPEIEYPALMIPLTEIKEKLTVIRGATGFDF